jgi:hypothetical protein
MKSPLLILATVFLAAGLYAGWLPLVRDRPQRTNPFDPAGKPQSAPAGVLATPTATPLPLCGGSDGAGLATFDSGLDGFAGETSAGYTVPTLSSTTPACKGPNALCGTFNLVHAGSAAKVAYRTTYGSGQNWTGKVLTARLHFPSGMGTASAKLYIKSAAFKYSNGVAVNAPAPGGWVSLSFDLAASPAYADPGTDTAQVKEVGMELYSNSGDPDGSFTVCLDSFDVAAGAPTATPTITLTATTGAPTTPTFTPTPTVTPTSLCGGSDTANFGTFEAGTETFAYETYAGPPPYQTVSFVAGTPACKGSQALCGTAAFSHSGGTVNALVAFKKNFSSVDWSGKTLSAYVYFPAGMGNAGGKLYVKVGAGYTGSYGTYVNAPAGGGWVLMTMPLSAIAGISDVRETGVDFYSAAAEPDGPFTLCIDGIDVL